MIKKLLTSFLVVSTFGTSIALGASKSVQDTLPNGKPFQLIAKEFVAVKTDIRSINEKVDDMIIDINVLEGRVGTLEDNVASMQTAINTLTIKQDNLIADMELAFSEIDTNREDIKAAFDEITRLAELSKVLESNINLNKDEIDDLMRQSLVQQAYIEANVEGIAQLNSDMKDNAQMITEVSNRLAAAEIELATKQNATSASCGEGQSLTKINPDGSFECSVNASSFENFADIGLKNVIVNNSGEIGGFIETTRQVTRPYYYRCYFLFWGWRWCIVYLNVTETVRTPITDSSVQVSCPENTMWTFDANYDLPSGVTLTSKKLTTDVDGIYTWTFNVNNPSGTVHNMNVSAQCVQKLEQATLEP